MGDYGWTLSGRIPSGPIVGLLPTIVRLPILAMHNLTAPYPLDWVVDLGGVRIIDPCFALIVGLVPSPSQLDF